MERSDSVDPSSLKYAKTHEWVHLDGDAASIGISGPGSVLIIGF